MSEARLNLSYVNLVHTHNSEIQATMWNTNYKLNIIFVKKQQHVKMLFTAEVVLISMIYRSE